jgi:hypothetical protein
VLPAIAFSKVEGLEVIPLRPSSAIRVWSSPVGDQTAAEIVEPDRLSEVLQGSEGFHGGFLREGVAAIGSPS